MDRYEIFCKEYVIEEFSSQEKFWHNIPVDTGRKLNVHKTFRRRPGRLLNVLCTFNLRPVSTGMTSSLQARTLPEEVRYLF